MIRLQGLDGTDFVVNIPEGCKRSRVLRALRRLHEGGDDAGIVLFGLTRRETEFLAIVVAELEERRGKAVAG